MTAGTLPSTLPSLFRSLGDPTRLRILRALQGAELSVGELAEVLELAQSGVSRHLAVLKAAGLVADRREATSSFYSVADDADQGQAGAIWPVVRASLAQLPHAKGDSSRRAGVLASRRARSEAYFQSVAPHWDSIRSAQHGDELRHLALLELVPRDLTVLDVGTGTGFMLLGIAQRVARVVGVDRSQAMLDQAAANLAAAGMRNVHLRQGEMEALPVEDASVDVVLANMALHHALEPRRAIVEMARVLRPGGRVVLTDLARHDLDWTREELADEWPGFAAEELLGHLRAARLRQSSVRPIGTCTLTRAGRERHAVDVLLASAVKDAHGKPPATSRTSKATRGAPRTTRTTHERDRTRKKT